jgi:hypothetical protein
MSRIKITVKCEQECGTGYKTWAKEVWIEETPKITEAIKELEKVLGNEIYGFCRPL